MRRDILELVHRYFDGEINQAEMLELESGLAESSELRREWVRIAILENKLSEAFDKAVPTETANKSMPPAHTIKGPAIAILAAAVLLFFSLLFLSNRNELNASQEFTRMLKSLAMGDRLYRIDVEQIVLPNTRQLEKYDNTRPPKPSLEGAKLYVRKSEQFVLMRFLEDGMPFVTGSDGKIGWAIAPNGPVRISRDTQVFNRDLPGHEHSISLANLAQGLTQIQKAYSIQVVSAPPSDGPDEQDTVLIATKRKGQRGPKRIEIQYDSRSGRIAQIRFIEMPYGPERQTVRLTLIDERSLPDSFFHHTFHQSLNQEVFESDSE